MKKIYLWTLLIPLAAPQAKQQLFYDTAWQTRVLPQDSRMHFTTGCKPLLTKKNLAIIQKRLSGDIYCYDALAKQGLFLLSGYMLPQDGVEGQALVLYEKTGARLKIVHSGKPMPDVGRDVHLNYLPLSKSRGLIIEEQPYDKRTDFTVYFRNHRSITRVTNFEITEKPEACNVHDTNSKILRSLRLTKKGGVHVLDVHGMKGTACLKVSKEKKNRAVLTMKPCRRKKQPSLCLSRS